MLLRPIRHRSEQAQMDLMVVRACAAQVARTSLVNTVRGLAKSVGERLPKVDAEALDVEDAKHCRMPCAKCSSRSCRA